MKNMFGIVPGAVYGWPKNVLHWHGIERSILDICSAMRPHFVIADGIVAMEGNGPLHGTGRALNKIVLSDDPVAADFTCARLMGLLPEKIYHLEQAARFLGNGAVEAIQLLGEAMPERIEPFTVLPQFERLRRIQAPSINPRNTGGSSGGINAGELQSPSPFTVGCTPAAGRIHCGERESKPAGFVATITMLFQRNGNLPTPRKDSTWKPASSSKRVKVLLDQNLMCP